ncbi:MAG: CRISPR-associated protein Csx15 [Actinomycetota bacterium]
MTSAGGREAVGIDHRPLLVVNFGHPLTPEQIEQMEALCARRVEKVIDVQARFDHHGPFPPQVHALADRCGLSPREWQTVPLVVNVPTFHLAAVAVLADLHGRIGHFPSILRLRPTPEVTPPRFEVAEVLNLQALRDQARDERR